MTLFRKSRSKGDIHQEFQSTVRFLDDSEPVQLPFTKETQGQYVLDKVCETLNLVEKDYFGLRYVDAEKQRLRHVKTQEVDVIPRNDITRVERTTVLFYAHWLDPTKTVYKQLKGVSPCVLCFRVKFYPEDPMKLHEEITRYYLFLQLRRDLHHGRLLCSPQDANLLAAYIIQSEVGDYDPQDHPAGYVAEFKMLPGQNVQQEQQIQELHKTLVGQVPAEAEAAFLKKAASLDTYGVDPHKVKDQKGNQMYLGVTHQGIMTFHGSRRTQIYKWSQIKKLAFEGKTFIAHVNINEKHQPIGYKCMTVAACKYLWRCAVEQQFFFTLQNSLNTPKVRSGGSLFSRGSKFRFSGRCQNEAYKASDEIKRQEPDFQRTCSLPNFARKSASVRMNNSANMSILEDKIGKGYKADTLPRMSSPQSVSAEPPTQNQNREKPRRSSQEMKGRWRASGEEVPERFEPEAKLPRKASVENTDIEPMEIRETIEMKQREAVTTKPKMSDTARPKLKEIARESSREVVHYTEVEQRQIVVKPIVVQAYTEPTPIDEQIVPTVRDARGDLRRSLRKGSDEQSSCHHHTPLHSKSPADPGSHIQENAVDVAYSTAEVPQSPTVKAPIQETREEIVAEEMVQVRAEVAESARPDTGKQNGGIPNLVVTSELGDSTPEDTSLPYNPENTLYDNDDDDERVAKSLEEQVMDLEKEYHEMTNRNHVQDSVEERLSPSQDVVSETKAVTPKKRGGCSCGKVLAYTFFSLFLTLAVSACVVMFSDIDHPWMNEARSHLTFLEPMRDFILDQYHQLVNKFS